MMRKRRTHWPQGTYMRIRTDILRAYTLNQEDMAFINAGKTRKVDPRKISQGLLAEESGVDRSFINHLTAGRRKSCKPATAERIAETLDVPLEVLFDVKTPTTDRQTTKHHTTERKAAA